MTKPTYSHMTDEELLRHVQVSDTTVLERELAKRLEDALDMVEEAEEVLNQHELQFVEVPIQ